MAASLLLLKVLIFNALQKNAYAYACYYYCL